jgi:N-acyl-phosphatidylethanolamine-hydrolysing phospholipase D
MKRTRYQNPYQKKVNRRFYHFLLWRMGCYRDTALLPTVPDTFSFPNVTDFFNEVLPSVTWVNHSTFLIRINGKSFLLDPIWNTRCSPFSFFGPKRKHPPSLLLEELDRVDYVVISHNHYDHLDKKTSYYLHALYPNITWVVPLGVKKWFTRHLPQIRREKIIELKWWDELTLDGFSVMGVPAQHFSGRGLFDRNRSLWMGFVVSFRNGKRFYFAGDTGYNAHDFKEIGRKFGPLDLSLLPIGAYLPRRFMRSVHINPEESIQIHRDTRSKLSVASHWGTFRLSSEALEQPPYDLYCALKNSEIPFAQFRVLRPGESINW